MMFFLCFGFRAKQCIVISENVLSGQCQIWWIRRRAFWNSSHIFQYLETSKTAFFESLIFLKKSGTQKMTFFCYVSDFEQSDVHWCQKTFCQVYVNFDGSEGVLFGTCHISFDIWRPSKIMFFESLMFVYLHSFQSCPLCRSVAAQRR